MLRENAFNPNMANLQEKLSGMEAVDFIACEYFRNRIPKWEALKPELIVMAPRTATVYQPLIKKVWEKVYGQGSCPDIINIDPININTNEDLKKYSKVLVFDDSSSLIKNNPAPILYNKHASIVDDEKSEYRPSLEKIGDFIYKEGVKEVWIDWGKKLWHPGEEALIRREVTKTGPKLVRHSNKEDKTKALDRAKKMRELGEFISELILNKVP